MPLPVWTSGNAFFNGAKPCDKEQDYLEDPEHVITLELAEENGTYYIRTNLKEYLPEVPVITTETLGMAFEPEERFEGPNGEDLIFDTDLYGTKRTEHPVAGPFA